MLCLLYSPDSINRLFHYRQPGYVPHVGTSEKKGCGAVDLVPRTTAPQPFSRLIAPPSSTTQMPSVPCAHEAIVLGQKAVSESLPYGGSHGGKNRHRHRKGTRAYSRLTEVNPYSAPVIRGHMCLVCQKSRFSSCSPFASREQSEKTITDTPWLFAVFVAPVVLAPR